MYVVLCRNKDGVISVEETQASLCSCISGWDGNGLPVANTVFILLSLNRPHGVPAVAQQTGSQSVVIHYLMYYEEEITVTTDGVIMGQ